MALTEGQKYGLAATGAVVAGVVAWQLYRRPTMAGGGNGGGPGPGGISETQAIRFADSWAASHRDALIRDLGLAVSRPIFSRIVFFVGQPPRLSQRFWDGLEDPGEYYYVEYEFLVADPLGGPDWSEWLTVMIDPFTGRKPEGRVYSGWTAGRLSRNFGL